VIVVTDGRLGYQGVAEKDTIVAVRQREAEDSYVRLGVPAGRVVFLGFPDMSLRPYQCWETPDGRPGADQGLLRLFREARAEAVLLPNAGDFHPDHKAANEAGQVAAVQARETLMPDLGAPAPIRQVLTYQVWEALERPAYRVELDETQAQRKRHSLRAYRSQGPIIEELLRRETLSFGEERFAELLRF
jgi:LmbE family N-acetylglucosaminyl deacetylase